MVSTVRIAPEAEHMALWNDRLQDWLDGDIAPADAAAVETHIANCSACQSELASFRQLDAALRATAAVPVLDTQFDARLFDRIEAIHSDTWNYRERLDQEARENLAALSQRWRLGLAFVIPSVIAAIALALALVGCFNSLPFGRPLFWELRPTTVAQLNLNLVITACISAGVGLGVAGWLCRMNE
jgi:anti-sigma factor RsiW